MEKKNLKVAAASGATSHGESCAGSWGVALCASPFARERTALPGD